MTLTQDSPTQRTSPRSVARPHPPRRPPAHPLAASHAPAPQQQRPADAQSASDGIRTSGTVAARVCHTARAPSGKAASLLSGIGGGPGTPSARSWGCGHARNAPMRLARGDSAPARLRIEPHASGAAKVRVCETESRVCTLRGAGAGRIGRGGRRPDADVGCADGGVWCDERKGAPAVPLS